jgi:UDP-sugar diphosphatase
MQHTVTNFRLEPLEKAHFVKTVLAKFEQNGIEKSWEIVESGNSVAILIYHKEKDAFILVKQFRPPVYHRHGGDGMTIELCAGLIDKKMSLEQIAKEEIEEECGYTVSLKSLERITKTLSSVGTAGNSQVIYYTEVDETMRVSEGGGIHDEMIEVIELPAKEAKTFMYNESIGKTVGLMFAFMWWFDKYGR